MALGAPTSSSATVRSALRRALRIDRDVAVGPAAEAFDTLLPRSQDHLNPSHKRGGSLPWVVLSQGVSSGGNLLLTIVCARQLGRVGFGGIAVAFTVYLLALGTVRAAVLDPYLIRVSGAADDVEPPRPRDAYSSVLVAALVASLLAFGIGAITSDAIRPAVWAIAAMLPALLFEDAVRYVAFSRGTPHLAIVADGTWAATEVVGFAVLLVAGVASGPAFLLAWGAAAAVGGIAAGATMERGRVSARHGGRWIRANADLGGRFASEYLLTQGTGYATLVALGMFGGAAAPGAISGAQTLYGPMSVITLGMLTGLTVDGARVYARTGDLARVRRHVLRPTMIAAASSLAFIVVLVLVPETLGRAVLGRTWASSKRVIVPMGLQSAALAVVMGSVAVFRATAAARESLRVRLFVAAFALVLPLVGGILGGVTWYAWCLAGSSTIGCLIWVVAARRLTVVSVAGATPGGTA